MLFLFLYIHILNIILVMVSWMNAKKEAELAYKAFQFSSASEKYEEALAILKSTNNDRNIKISLEAAKILSNASLMNLKLYETSDHHVDNHLILQKAENLAIQSIKHDHSWSKSHLRLSQIYFHDKSESGEFKALSSMMNFMELSTEADTKTEVIISHLSKLCYFTHKCVMKKSPSWHMVKFPNNVFSIDANGAGHFKSLNAVIAALKTGFGLQCKDGISVLVRPGIYYGIHYIFAFTIDIVGDCNTELDNESGAILTEPSVVFQNVAKSQLSVHPEHDLLRSCTFYVICDCKIWFSRVSVREIIMLHPINCIYVVDSELNMNQCSVNSICSASICNKDSNIVLKSCRSVGSYGFLLSGGAASVNKLENCYVRETNGMAIEIRADSRLIELLNSTIVKCCGQGLSVGSGSKKAVVKGCVFEGNCSKSSNLYNGAIQLKCCENVFISNTEFKEHKSVAIVIEGGFGIFENIKVSKCVNGFLVQAPVNISSCSISECLIGVSICEHIAGDVIFTNNNIEKCIQGIAKLNGSPDPIFRGSKQHRISVLNLHNATYVHLKEKLHQRRKGRKENQDFGPVGDVLGNNAGKKINCGYCTLSEGLLGRKFLTCSGCKVEVYCSQKCQQKDWDYHEPFCSSAQDKNRVNISSKKRQELAKNEIEVAFSDMKMSAIVETDAVADKTSNSKQAVPKNLGKNKKKNKKKKTNHF